MNLNQFFDQTRIAIVGTAGRNDDILKLNTDPEYNWYMMCNYTMSILGRIKTNKHKVLVSGGSAWADYIAVLLAEESHFPLDVYFPNNKNDIETLEYYHSKFSLATNQKNTYENTLKYVKESKGSFKDRNLKVAQNCDICIALTFGSNTHNISKYEGKISAEEAGLKPGGTAHTWNNLPENIEKWHINLNRILQ